MHDFGIIPDIKEFMNSSPYEYVPEKYNCISIGMDTSAT